MKLMMGGHVTAGLIRESFGMDNLKVIDFLNEIARLHLDKEHTPIGWMYEFQTIFSELDVPIRYLGAGENVIMIFMRDEYTYFDLIVQGEYVIFDYCGNMGLSLKGSNNG